MALKHIQTFHPDTIPKDSEGMFYTPTVTNSKKVVCIVALQMPHADFTCGLNFVVLHITGFQIILHQRLKGQGGHKIPYKMAPHRKNWIFLLNFSWQAEIAWAITVLSIVVPRQVSLAFKLGKH